MGRTDKLRKLTFYRELNNIFDDRLAMPALKALNAVKLIAAPPNTTQRPHKAARRSHFLRLRIKDHVKSSIAGIGDQLAMPVNVRGRKYKAEHTSLTRSEQVQQRPMIVMSDMDEEAEFASQRPFMTPVEVDNI